VTRPPIVLHVDHRHGRRPRSLDESGNARNRFVERPVDFLLACQDGVIQNAALDIDDQKCGFLGSHTSIYQNWRRKYSPLNNIPAFR